MKAIVLNAILSSFRSRKDKSIGFSVSTGEFSVPERVAIMELEGINVRMLIEPQDYEPEGKIAVDKELHSKTPSERLRAILFVKFRQSGEKIEFIDYYIREINRICEAEKAQLEPSPF